jgi:very-short-patch-repair endonuclease
MRSTKNFKSLPYDRSLLKRARELRRAGMLHEVLVWNRIKQGQLNGVDFDRQKVIGRYNVDFYCPEKRTVIEIDGSSHAARGEYDETR